MLEIIEAPRRKRGRPKKKKPEENEKILNENKSNTPLLMIKKEKSRPSNQDKKPTIDTVKKELASLYRQFLPAVDNVLFNYSQYNPFLANTRLKMISSYPSSYSPEAISNFLLDPQFHEIELRSAGWALSASQQLYYKILREASDVPMFKHFITPPILNKEEYLSKKFIDEEEFVEDWLQALDIINTMKKIALEVKREGKSTYVFRQCINSVNGKKKPSYVAWQKLPSNYTKLTAIGEHGYIASFNLLVFLNPAFSPLQYPEYIQNIWHDLMGSGAIVINDQGEKKIDANKLRQYSYTIGDIGKAGTLEMQDNVYMYWVQLPQDLCFTFASDTSHAWVAPDTMGLFSSLQELTDYSVLAGLVASTPLTSVLTGQAETCSGAEPGQSQTVLSPDNMLSFQNAFNSIAPGNTMAFLAPFKDLKLQSIPHVPNATDIKTAALQNFVASAGEGGIITATDKPSVAMIKGAQLLAASQYESVTRQFETVINMLLKKWTDLTYEWRVHLWGDIFNFDNTVKSLKEQVLTGSSYLLPKLVSANDMTMREVRGINGYIEAFEVYEQFRPLNWATAQLTPEADNTEEITGEVGRPKTDIGDLENDNTAISQDAGNNVSDIKEFKVFIEQGLCPICQEMVEEGQILCESCAGDLGTNEGEAV